LDVPISLNASRLRSLRQASLHGRTSQGERNTGCAAGERDWEGEKDGGTYYKDMDSRFNREWGLGVRAVTEGLTPGGITNCTPCE